MDGKGCWRDNVFVDRLWRSAEYEEVYLHGYETMFDVRAGLARYFPVLQSTSSAEGRDVGDVEPGQRFSLRPCLNC